MSVERKIAHRTKRRQLRIRKRVKSSSLPRVSVFRSLKQIYAQLIDDQQQRTLVSCSSVELTGLKGDKKEIAHAVGKELASRALQNGVTAAVFDRGSFLFHGRVKSLAEGLREGGLKI